MFNKRGLSPVPMNFSMQDVMIDIENNVGNIYIDFVQSVNQANQVNNQSIIELMQERIVQRIIMHEISQV